MANKTVGRKEPGWFTNPKEEAGIHGELFSNLIILLAAPEKLPGFGW